jgi:hypothetical protein
MRSVGWSNWQNPRYPQFGSLIDDEISHLRIALHNGSDPTINNFGGAVQALQAAGNEAATLLGPKIDSLSGGNANVMRMTQWAWSKNGHLNSLPNTDLATKDTLSSAVVDIRQMLDWYSQAHRLAQSIHYIPPHTIAPSITYTTPTITTTLPEPVERTWWQKFVDWLTA